MARIRTIKPEFWQDEKLAPCAPITRLVFLGLIGMADDAGRLLDNVKIIDAFIFPETSETSRGSIGELSAMGRIRRGITASGQRIIEIVNWNTHQKIEKPNLRGALPPIVQEVQEPQQVTEIPRHVGETSGKDRGGVGDASENHTNDLRPVPTTNDPLTDDAFAPPVPDRRARPRTAKAPAAFPHFSRDLCNRLHAVWVSSMGAVDYPRFRKALGPLFTIPEADRPTGAPSDAELSDALKSYADLAPTGAAARFASIEAAAKVLSAIALTRRDLAEHPDRRVEAVQRIIHGNTARTAA